MLNRNLAYLDKQTSFSVVQNIQFVEKSVILNISHYLISLRVSIPICLVVVQGENINTINRSDIIKIVNI